MATDDIITERPPDGESVIGRDADFDTQRLIKILQGYKQEAENDRKGGDSTRDAIWDENVKLYWGKFADLGYFKNKEPWQSKEVMPEIPMFVDRWAASMREAINKPGDFFAVNMPDDPNGQFEPAIKKFIVYLLSKCGRNQSGHPVDFSTVFEQILKMMAMMTGTASVTWKGDYVAVEALDARNVWLDAKGRGLYRIREMEIDHHELMAMAKQTDKKDNDIWNVEEIEQLSAHNSQEVGENKESLGGAGNESSPTPRKPIKLEEFYCTVIDEEGEVLHEDVLIVLANGQFLIRGPEKNPFTHGMDWIVSAPAITVPTSTYGKSYMENWADVAVAFNEMTNLILDGVFTSTMNAFGVIEDAMIEPSQANDGIHPNKMYKFEEGTNIATAFVSLDLGRLPPESIQVWQGLKAELREGAAFNELSLGQVPPKGDITATEINASTQGAAVTTRSIARTIEQNILDVILMLVFKTGLQHLSENDAGAKAALGERVFQAILKRKKDFFNDNIVITVNGISELIDRGEKLRSLIRMIEILGQNELLLKTFLKKYDMPSVLDEMIRLSGIDTSKLTPKPQVKVTASLIENEEQRVENVKEIQKNAPAQPPASDIANDVIQQVIAAQQKGQGNGG